MGTGAHLAVPERMHAFQGLWVLVSMVLMLSLLQHLAESKSSAATCAAAALESVMSACAHMHAGNWVLECGLRLWLSLLQLTANSESGT